MLTFLFVNKMNYFYTVEQADLKNFIIVQEQVYYKSQV